MLENMMVAMSHKLGISPPFNGLTMGMIRLNGTKRPKMKLKAGEGRHFLPVLMEMLKCFSMGSEHARRRYNCANLLNNCYLEMKNWNDADSPLRLARFARKHLIAYKEISDSMDDRLRWQMYPKHHLFLHCAESAQSNPSIEWNYMDESEIGFAVQVCSRMHSKYIHLKLIERYCETFGLVDPFAQTV